MGDSSYLRLSIMIFITDAGVCVSHVSVTVVHVANYWEDQRQPETNYGTDASGNQLTAPDASYPGATEDHPGFNEKSGCCSRHPSGCAAGGVPYHADQWVAQQQHLRANNRLPEEGDEEEERGPDGPGIPRPVDLPNYSIWGQVLRRFGR